jgi:cytoskeletal protein CcmA (bactofilin family)
VDGIYEGLMKAEKILIQSKANVDFAREVYARNVEVEGKVRGTFVCDGRLTVRKKGALEGTIHARSVAVDKGGILAGNIHARSIAVEKGGMFSGSLKIDQEAPAALQSPEQWTWFATEHADDQTLAAEDFGDFPPSVDISFPEDEEVLQQPQIELHIKRKPRK